MRGENQCVCEFPSLIPALIAISLSLSLCAAELDEGGTGSSAKQIFSYSLRLSMADVGFSLLQDELSLSLMHFWSSFVRLARDMNCARASITRFRR